MDEYHDLSLTEKLSALHIGYQRVNAVVPNGDIAATLDNLEMSVTANQRHVDQMISTTNQMKETKKILGDQLK